MATYLIFDRKTGDILQTHVEPEEVNTSKDDLLSMVDPAYDRSLLEVVLVDAEALKDGEPLKLDPRTKQVTVSKRGKITGFGAGGARVFDSEAPSQPLATESAPGRMAKDPREELLRALKGENVEGFDFATREDDVEITSSLTNRAVKDLITLEGAAILPLQYTGTTQKRTGTSTFYKTAVSKTGTEVKLVVTDIATGRVVSTETFPPPKSHEGPTFDSIEECLRDFDCKLRGQIQCEANRTCQDQLVGLTCCLNNGQCFSVHLIIRPTTFHCKLREFIPNLEGMVLSPE